MTLEDSTLFDTILPYRACVGAAVGAGVILAVAAICYGLNGVIMAATHYFA
jgi:hypothetical protein